MYGLSIAARRAARKLPLGIFFLKNSRKKCRFHPPWGLMDGGCICYIGINVNFASIVNECKMQI